MEYLEGMLQREKDNFSRVCNRLLGTCFLCKGNQNTKADSYPSNLESLRNTGKNLKNIWAFLAIVLR